MTLSRGAVISFELTDIAHGGEAIGRYDGQVVFVPYGIPGEKVQVEITQTKNSFARGRIKEVLVASSKRVSPRCKYFFHCGGCQWQHIDYLTQLELKQSVV